MFIICRANFLPLVILYSHFDGFHDAENSPYYENAGLPDARLSAPKDGYFAVPNATHPFNGCVVRLLTPA
jgi:hypothetical protein